MLKRFHIAVLMTGLSTVLALVGGPFADAASPAPGLAHATFAGGCFWCMEGPFDRLPGVVSTTSGYTGGNVKKPSYEQVSSGMTGHAESVDVVYDPAKVTYAQLLEVFWHNVDPTDGGGQFCDRGNQYRTAIFYHDDEQRRLAEQSKEALEAAGTLKKKKIVTQIVPATEFYPAEDYHQDYATRNPLRYKYYRFNCGRDQRLKELWGEAPAH
ncbi:MAG: peptide-methionine (S)-S-oxide reductase [Acidobacteria bacterium]|nr:MAG: peptide-methionine (S)-S-oxide reductase [Acidobacteriota bacterium]